MRFVVCGLRLTKHLLERACDGGRYRPRGGEEECKRFCYDGSVVWNRSRGQIVVGFNPARGRAFFFGAIKKHDREGLACALGDHTNTNVRTMQKEWLGRVACSMRAACERMSRATQNQGVGGRLPSIPNCSTICGVAARQQQRTCRGMNASVSVVECGRA